MLPLNRQNKTAEVKVLGIDISHRSPIVQFLTLSTTVFVFYLIYGYAQEAMFRIPGMRPFGWYLTFLQFVIYATFSYLEMSITNGVIKRIPYKTYFHLAFYTVATMGLSNASVGYLNYPTQVIFKCCKPIPVLVGGVLIQGKRYGFLDVFSAALMSLGLVLFSLADNEISPNFDARGYAMISLALVADTFIGNVQEKAMRGYGAFNDEVVLYSYSIGAVYIFCGILLTGELFNAFVFFAQNPMKMYGYVLIYSMVGYLGVNVVLTLVRVSGALVAATVTTMRKAITIILSFYFFDKPFTVAYVWSGLIVLAAIYLNVYNKNRHAFDTTFSALRRFIFTVTASSSSCVMSATEKRRKVLISV